MPPFPEIRFLVPPANKQVGGIAAFLKGLRSSLCSKGLLVKEGARFLGGGSIHHVHGIWNVRNSLICYFFIIFRKPYIISPHGMLEPWALAHKGVKKTLYLRLIEARVLKGAARVFVTSEIERRNVLRAVPEARTQTHAVGQFEVRKDDYDRARVSLGISEDETVLLFLSRIDEKKGLDLLLAALAENLKRYSRVSLFVVGDGLGPYVCSLRQKSDAIAGSLRRIEWMGAVWGDARWSFLQAADVFCLPTHSENFGLAVLEALSVGTPVLTTDKTPWAESTLPGLHICAPEAHDVARALLEAIVGSSEWSQIKRSSLSSQVRAKFDWAKIVDSYILAYDEVFKEYERFYEA